MRNRAKMVWPANGRATNVQIEDGAESSVSAIYSLRPLPVKAIHTKRSFPPRPLWSSSTNHTASAVMLIGVRGNLPKVLSHD